jgi:hypothetical protein
MIRAPDTKKLTREPFDWIFKTPFDGRFAFTEAQWRLIESSLAFPETRIDPDAEMVGGLFRVWGQQPRPLREALSEVAHYAARAHAGKLPTPKQCAEELREAQAAVEKAFAALTHTDDFSGHTDPHLEYPTWDEFCLRHERDRVLQAAITQKIAELRERIDQLEAMGTRSTESRRSAHNDYWRALTRLWLGITEGKVSKHRRRHLCRFLYACSQPIFPETTEQTLDSFVRNFFRSGLNGPQKASVV